MLIKFKVTTNAKNNSISTLKNDLYKLKINAVAVDGKANKEIINYLSKSLHISKSSVSIIHGHYSNNKTIDIEVQEHKWLSFISNQK